jgi:putative methyltransferase (TIGR04325 family)
MARLKRLALLLLPPILAQAIVRARAWLSGVTVGAVLKPHWQMVPDTDEAWTAREGWSHGSIAETQCGKWQSFLSSLEGCRPFGRSHEAAADASLDVGPHNTIMSFGYVLGRVATSRIPAPASQARMSVLDWGGGIGHYYVYASRLHPDLDLDYVIKDLPGLCAVGRELLPQVTFHSSEEQALGRQYDLVFASSSLHYARDCYGLLGRLCDSAKSWLMVTRLPIVERSDDFVVVQRPHMFGYMTEYAGWFMNRRRLLEFMRGCDFDLDREFLVAERPHVPNAPEQGQYCGFLFRRVR